MKIFLSLILILLGMPVVAGQWTPTGQKINEIYLHNQYGGYVFVKVNDMSFNPYGCNAEDRYYVLSKSNNPFFSEIYSFLLTAYTTQKPIKVFLDHRVEFKCSEHDHPTILHAKSLPNA